MILLKQTKESYDNGILLTGIIILLLFAGSTSMEAQEDPPRPPSITVTGDLSFGAFYHGAAGGTVIISPAGARTSTGDIVLLGMGYSYSPARFNIYSNAVLPRLSRRASLWYSLPLFNSSPKYPPVSFIAARIC